MWVYAFRAKELGPEGESKEKKVIDLDYHNDCNEEDENEISLSNSQSQYKNAELAMLCTKAVSYQIETHSYSTIKSLVHYLVVSEFLNLNKSCVVLLFS